MSTLIPYEQRVTFYVVERECVRGVAPRVSPRPPDLDPTNPDPDADRLVAKTLNGPW